jgi:hypothetical protein
MKLAYEVVLLSILITAAYGATRMRGRKKRIEPFTDLLYGEKGESPSPLKNKAFRGNILGICKLRETRGADELLDISED